MVKDLIKKYMQDSCICKDNNLFKRYSEVFGQQEAAFFILCFEILLRNEGSEIYWSRFLTLLK